MFGWLFGRDYKQEQIDWLRSEKELHEKKLPVSDFWFVYQFPEGSKNSNDMTREELLLVVQGLMADMDWWRAMAQRRLGT